MAAPTMYPASAEAATIGRMVSIGGWQIGAFLSSNGHYVYCIEPGAVEPSSEQKTAKTVSSLPGYSGGTFDPTGWRGTVKSEGLSGTKLRQINYVLWTHGRTKNASTAAAVQLAVWMLRADPGVKQWLDYHLDWARDHGGRAYIKRAKRLVNEARSKAVPASAPKPASLVIERDDASTLDPSASDASLTKGGPVEGGLVRYPAGMTQLSIEGGVFAHGEQEIAVKPSSQGVAKWSATLYDSGWRGEHEVAISGKWKASATGWPARVKIYPPQNKGQQRLAAGVSPETEQFTGTSNAADAVDAQFSPVLSTQVNEKFVGSGDAFVDTVTFESADLAKPWPVRNTSDGRTEYAPMIANGRVYGPFDAPQPVGAEPPKGAQVAAGAQLIAKDGPGEYQVEADRPVAEPGYYYWVWSIKEDEQLAEIREGGLLPAGYRFSDDFGLVAEGQISPMALRWSTKLESRELTLDELVLRDHVEVSADGGTWLRDEAGTRIPVRIRLTAYQSTTKPSRQHDVPDDAKELAQGLVDVAGPGVETAIDPIALPTDTRGWVTVRACLVAEDQPEAWRGYTEEWCDDYGVPSETAQIAVLELLSRTGSSASESLAGFSTLGVGLVSAGAGVLLAGGLFRQFGRRKSA